MNTPDSDVIEPVHWHAHLIRSSDVVYTEVDGVPVLVGIPEGTVTILTPTWAAIWARLDGRTVVDALEIDETALGPVDARTLIEVIRRLKAADLIHDIDPSTTAARVDEVDRQSRLEDQTTIVCKGEGSVGDDTTVVTLDPAASTQITLQVTEGPTGMQWSLRDRSRWVPVARFVVGESPTAPSGATARFITVIGALEDPSVLVRPGLGDLLAELAERADAPGSLPRRT